MAEKKEKIDWNIKRQAEIAKQSFEKRPLWVKSISHFSGTNTSTNGPVTKGSSDKEQSKK